MSLEGSKLICASIGLDDLPLIQKDGSLNLGVTLGILGFFRQYIQDRQSPMRRLYDQLPVAKKPKKWIETLENATNPIGQKWIGISCEYLNSLLFQLS